MLNSLECVSLEISSTNFHWSVLPDWTPVNPNLSSFDEALLSSWKEAARKGRFNYDICIEGSKALPGQWRFLADLNVQRREKRRKPQDIQSVNEPFNPNKFNFTQIHSDEILFRLQGSQQQQGAVDLDLLVINNSPINEGHCLLLPAVDKTYPQTLTEHAIVLGLQVLLMSKSPAFRVVFNGLCACASVNHLHLHVLYVNQSMLLESCRLQPLAGPCCQLIDYPARGFVFQSLVNCDADIIQLSRNVFKLTNFLQNQNEAHNVCMTRSRNDPNDSTLSLIRVFVWARTSSRGPKNVSGFNPAACELFGFILYNDRELYECSSEDCVASILEEITKEPFERCSHFVKELFSED